LKHNKKLTASQLSLLPVIRSLNQGRYRWTTNIKWLDTSKALH